MDAHPLDPRAMLDPRAAEGAARVLDALASPARLRLLTALRAGPASVGELCAAVGMEQSAVSHQLRLLKDRELVTGERQGRRVVYALHDHHVARLLDEVAAHLAHRAEVTR